MIELVEKIDIDPICPHCSNKINQLWFKELKNFLGKRYIYFCSQCEKVLGVSHRKGFFMG